MATTRIRVTTLAAVRRRIAGPALTAAAAALAAVAVLAGCGQANVGHAVPAGSSGGTGTTAGSGPAGGSGSGAGSGAQPGPGTVSGSPAVAPMAARVCSAPGAVRTVRVTRIPGLGQPGPGKPVPSARPAITIDSRDRSIALARAICALPPMPRGVLSCPVDIGGGFGLVFATPDLRLPAVTIRSSGCEMVVGASRGRPRWIPAAPGFWATFARLTGIKSPAHRP